MSSTLKVNVKAKNKDGNVTKNYNKKCYAKNINLSADYELSKEINESIKYLLTRLNSKDTNFSVGDSIELSVDKSVFTTDDNGSANLAIYLNFDKNYTTPIGEFNATFTKVTIKDDDNVEGYKEDNQTSTFRYARIKVKNIAGYSNKLNESFEYMIWDEDDGWIAANHNETYGKANEDSSKASNVDLDFNDSFTNEQNATFSTTHALPYSAKVHIDIPSWLWYHPLAKDYKAPSEDNLDCLTHPCMKVNFMSENSGWGGVGRESKRYNESNKTINIDISGKVEAEKKEMKKLSW